MNWDAISAVGEIIGAVAVVLSLIYVAVQIRQNTKIVAANTFQSVSATSSEITMRIAENSELSDLMMRAFSEPENLTPKESFRIQLVLRSAFRNFENFYYQHNLGYFKEDMWAGYRQTILDTFRGRFAAAWWKSHQVAFGSEFVDFVNSNLKQRSPQQSPWENVELGEQESDS